MEIISNINYKRNKYHFNNFEYNCIINIYITNTYL